MKSLVFLVIVGFAFQAAVQSTTTARTTAPTTFSSTSTTTTAPTNFSSTTTTTPPTTTTTTVRSTAPTTFTSTTTTTPPTTVRTTAPTTFTSTTTTTARTTVRTTAPTTFSSTTTTTVRTTAPTTFTSTTTTTARTTAPTTFTSTTTTTARTTAPTTFSSTTTTTPPTTSGTNICQNGGTYDGIKCVCDPIYYGTWCENVIDRVSVKTVDTTVKVELKIMREFDEKLKNNQSEEYKVFEKEFKALMDDAYSGLDGYQRVDIVGLRPGSIIVDHNVIVELEYKVGVNIEEEYEIILQKVNKTVNEVKESSQNCTDGNSNSFCFNSTYGSVEPVEIPNADFCEKTIGSDLIEFYTQDITSEGLTCISHCDESSPKRVDCNTGRCVIQTGMGLQCFCPRTDIYMYTGPKCTGIIQKSALYGGVGAAIAVLAIIVAIGVFFLCKRKKKKTKQNKYMYDDNDESNDYHEITNMGFHKEGPSVNRQSNTDKFKPKRGNFNKG